MTLNNNSRLKTNLLIPVLEINYNDESIPWPDQYPYWQHPDIWESYRKSCYQYAGFKDELIPYLKGSPFFKVSDLSDANLTKLVLDHTDDFRLGKFDRDQSSPLFGGFVLQVDGQDQFFPQCCGDLSDYRYWERLSMGLPSYYEGHPAPQISFEKDGICFDFSVYDLSESFQPPPFATFLTIKQSALHQAVAKAKVELQALEVRLNRINDQQSLNIENIGGLLIWDNPNYDDP